MLHHTHLEFKEELDNLSEDGKRYIILHHTAVSRPHTVYDVHRSHIKNGMAGIAYHFFIGKDGEIFEGRPIGTAGAHTKGYNKNSIGVCFEGNFNNEKMGDKQMEASVMLLSLLSLANEDEDVEICRHDDLVLGKVPSPGKLFPFDELMGRVKQCKHWFRALFGKERDHKPRHLGDDKAARKRVNAPDYFWAGNFYYEKIINLFDIIEEEGEF